LKIRYNRGNKNNMSINKGSGIMIRKATKDDVKEVAPLILLASSCLFKDALASNNYVAQLSLVHKFYLQPNNKFSFHNIIVLEHNKQVVACLVSYLALQEDYFNENMNKILSNGYVFNKEALDNTLYIDTLAVDPLYQGCGYGTLLVEHLIKNNKCDISLLVEQPKLKARLFYERLGFKALSLITLFNIKLYPMVLEQHNGTS
ncbi:MAG: GNAT family N-acetyltransferase, partial [Bacilli bacterium]